MGQPTQSLDPVLLDTCSLTLNRLLRTKIKKDLKISAETGLLKSVTPQYLPLFSPSSAKGGGG